MSPKLYLVCDNPKLIDGLVESARALPYMPNSQQQQQQQQQRIRFFSSFHKLKKVLPMYSRPSRVLSTNVEIIRSSSNSPHQQVIFPQQNHQPILVVIEAATCEDAMERLSRFPHEYHPSAFFTVIMPNESEAKQLSRSYGNDGCPHWLDVFHINETVGHERVLLQSMMIKQTLFLAGFLDI